MLRPLLMMTFSLSLSLSLCEISKRYVLRICVYTLLLTYIMQIPFESHREFNDIHCDQNETAEAKTTADAKELRQRPGQRNPDQE